jgi:hypothetical protein
MKAQYNQNPQAFIPHRRVVKSRPWGLAAAVLLTAGVAWLGFTRGKRRKGPSPGGGLLAAAGHEAQVLAGEASKDKTYTSRRTYPDAAAALPAFAWAEEKLFDVNAWSNLPGITAKFALHDESGAEKTSTPRTGDYIRIQLPGPLPENWVRVVGVQVEDQAAEFTVQPSRDPREGAARGEIEHFFGKEATSTFRVELQGNTLIASEIGRHEHINNQGKEAGGRAVLNTLVAEGGWAFFQKMQWQKLTDYLVHQ